MSSLPWRELPGISCFRSTISKIVAVEIKHRKSGLGQGLPWPPARLRPVGDYAPEGRAYTSESATGLQQAIVNASEMEVQTIL